MGSSSITHRELSLSTRKHCQEMLGNLVFLCHGHQARWSAETCLHSLRSHRMGNLFFFSSWEFIWQGIFMALLGSRSQTLDDSQKRGCGLFKHYLKSGSYNVWRRSKQARAKLTAQNSGVTPQCLGQAVMGYKCKPEKEGQLSKQENLHFQCKPHLQHPERRCEQKKA